MPRSPEGERPEREATDQVQVMARMRDGFGDQAARFERKAQEEENSKDREYYKMRANEFETRAGELAESASVRDEQMTMESFGFLNRWLRRVALMAETRQGKLLTLSEADGDKGNPAKLAAARLFREAVGAKLDFVSLETEDRDTHRVSCLTGIRGIKLYQTYGRDDTSVEAREEGGQEITIKEGAIPQYEVYQLG